MNVKGKVKLYFPALMATFLLVGAYFHSLMIEDVNRYKESWLIDVEFLLLLLSTIGVFVLGLTVIILLSKRSWKMALHGLVSLLITIVLIVTSMAVDEATLVYMT